MQTCSSCLDITIQSAQWPLERNFLQYLTKAENKLLYITVPVCILDIYQKPCCNCPGAPACPKRIRFGKETFPRRQQDLEILKKNTQVTQQTVVVDQDLAVTTAHTSPRPQQSWWNFLSQGLQFATHKDHLLQEPSGYKALAPGYPLSLKKRHGLKVLSLPICAQWEACLLCDQNTHCKGHTWKWGWADCSHHVWAHMRGVVTALNVLSLQDGKHQQFSHVELCFLTHDQKDDRALQKERIICHTYPPQNLGERKQKSDLGAN